jgi:hypothetical protein
MGAEIYPTKHVREQMDVRDVTWGEIVDCVDHSEVIYGPDHRGRKIYQKGELGVVVGNDGAIVTVLLRERQQWTDEQMRERGYQRPDKRKD